MVDSALDRKNPGSERAGRRTRSFYALVFLSFSMIGLWVYQGALRGPFISDDALYIVGNPYVRTSVPNLFTALFDPTGSARLDSGGNYAPVHILAHVLEWRLWGARTPGYHLVNVAFHALNATLLVALLCAASIGTIWATAAGLLFLVHPANVEAVAWISQLKSLLGLGFALAALLLYRTRPLASVPLFALALLSKAIAAFALPMAAGFWWAWRRGEGGGRRHGLGLLLYVVIFAVYAPIQFTAFEVSGLDTGDRYADAMTQLRSMAAIGARYIAMATTGYGTSAAHHPEPVISSLDPWWLAGLVLAFGFVWRMATTLRDRREEAGWWLGAAAAYAPVSQFYPFFGGMADRYLYFVLPGLLGGSILAARNLLVARFRMQARRSASVGTSVAMGAIALMALYLVFQARERAVLWIDANRLTADSVANYPDSPVAHFSRAVAAIEAGDHDRAVDHLRQSAARGANNHRPFGIDPDLRALRGNPRFEALLDDLARDDIALAGERDLTSQSMLRRLALSHYRLGELDEAIAILEDAIRRGGPRRAELVTLYGELRTARALRRRAVEE